VLRFVYAMFLQYIARVLKIGLPLFLRDAQANVRRLHVAANIEARSTRQRADLIDAKLPSEFLSSKRASRFRTPWPTLSLNVAMAWSRAAECALRQRSFEDAANQLRVHIALSQVAARNITLHKLQSARRSIGTGGLKNLPGRGPSTHNGSGNER